MGSKQIQIAPDCYIDPAEVFITYRGQTYYRDGYLTGYVLPESPVDEIPIPTLWSQIVINYRKKPVEIQAVQLMPENVDEVAAWCGGQRVEEIDAVDSSKRFVALNIPTLEGVMRASEGDYVIKGVKGEFYPCKPDIFAATYELV